jgi:transcriptional regulator with XRE-family HTH domain
MSYAAPILTRRAVTTAYRHYQDAVALGQKIRWARDWAQLSQQQLADYAGMSSSTLGLIESGERGTTGAERASLARGLGVSLGYLVVAGNGNGHRNGRS